MKNIDNTVLVIAAAYCLLHLLILLQIMPLNIVWGGKIESVDTIYILEGIALVTMAFPGLVIMIKKRIIKPIFGEKAISRILLIYAFFFMLNTVGNLLAETYIEKVQAAITLYLAVALFYLSKPKPHENT
ncbi:hypothetical protein [Salinimicrobium sp. HB62]|uniref:hypothetical protein n=1 Tax=Salinimicrobium sp. HB62 TaxID=3077781 RepID=UPI002D79A31B|nr:hypothetical protein [Salinimicrobium sp. HB62]